MAVLKDSWTPSPISRKKGGQCMRRENCMWEDWWRAITLQWMPSSPPFKTRIRVLLFNPKSSEGLQGALQYVPCSWESQGTSHIGRKARVGCGLEFAFSPCHLGTREGPLSALVAKSVETAAFGWPLTTGYIRARDARVWPMDLKWPWKRESWHRASLGPDQKCKAISAERGWRCPARFQT